MVKSVKKAKDNFDYLYPVLVDGKIMYQHYKIQSGVESITENIGSMFRLTSVSHLCIVSNGNYEYLYDIEKAKKISMDVAKIDDFFKYTDHLGADIVARVKEHLPSFKNDIGEIIYYINTEGKIVTDIYSSYLNKIYNSYLGYNKILNTIKKDLEKQQTKKEEATSLLLKIRHRNTNK